jgi:diacylglycerol kinase (ATP)
VPRFKSLAVRQVNVLREGVRPTGLRRLWLATLNSWRGLVHCYHSEAAFRQEVWVATVALPLAMLLGRDPVERILLAGSILVVMIVELLNTAVEVVVDRIGVEHHHLSGFAKDLGSSAVLLSLLLAASTWLLVLTGGDRLR